MSLVPRSLRKMRIIAVPLARPRTNLGGAKGPRDALTFYQFQISKPKQQPPKDNTIEQRQKPRWLPEEGVVKFVSNKAATTWAGWGRAPKGSWKSRVFQMGERLIDRLDFEELALKGVDPSLGPSLTQFSRKEAPEKGPQIPLIYPSSLSSDSAALYDLKKLVEHRMPRHKRGFYFWMIIAPFTAPFMLVPVIPNLPFFFCVWRSWSHYKAYKATQYLQDLLANNAIIPEGSQALDAIFKDFSPKTVALPPHHNTSSTMSSTQDVQHILLTKDAVPAIISLFGLQESAAADIHRAIEQARLRIESE